jgi:putative phage-type endonuclease
MVATLTESLAAFTPTQLEARRGGIGGSEISAIIGESPFAGPLDVWLSKVQGHDRPSTDDMERGQFLEDGIARWYAHREGVALATCETRWHATRPHVFATPDRLAWVGASVERLVSIKAPRRAGDAWGETGGGHVPVGYVLQLQWEWAVLASHGAHLDPLMHLAALIDGELRVYPVAADVELQARLLDFAAGWWARHVEARVPPPLDGSQGAKEWVRRRYPRDTQPSREATLAEEALLLALRDAETASDEAEAVYETARRRVEEAIGDAGGLSGASGSVTWRANKKGVRTFKPTWRQEHG